MNKTILIGNLTRDPEMRMTGNGISVATFSIAVQRRFANAQGERTTDYFNIVAWRGLADNCGRYIKKGSKVAVSGPLQNRSFEDKDGVKRYVTEIIADEVDFLTPTKQSTDDNPPAGEQSTVYGEAEENEDLPF